MQPCLEAMHSHARLAPAFVGAAALAAYRRTKSRETTQISLRRMAKVARVGPGHGARVAPNGGRCAVVVNCARLQLAICTVWWSGVVWWWHGGGVWVLSGAVVSRC